MSQEKLNEELAALEAALRSLGPRPSNVDRGRVMFLAGQAAGKRSLSAKRRRASWVWPCVAVVSLVMATTFGGLLFVRDQPQVEERVVYVKANGTDVKPDENGEVEVADHQGPRTPDRPQTRSPDVYRLVLIHGIEALPELKPAPGRGAGVPTWRPGSGSDLQRLFGG